VFNLWGEIQTQWHVSDGRPIGLRYEGVIVCLNLCRTIKKRDRAAVFGLLQAMESAALNEWSNKR
jgi:hypothetical protein